MEGCKSSLGICVIPVFVARFKPELAGRLFVVKLSDSVDKHPKGHWVLFQVLNDSFRGFVPQIKVTRRIAV